MDLDIKKLLDCAYKKEKKLVYSRFRWAYMFAHISQVDERPGDCPIKLNGLRKRRKITEKEKIKEEKNY